ncbi:MAG: cytochrome P450 [Acidimicrobiales bacterium]
MDTTTSTAAPITDEWCVHHFDYLRPELTRELHATLARMRVLCPVTFSDQLGGYWVVTDYEDVLRVAQDWEAFSSQLGVGIPEKATTPLAIPEHIDPPLHRDYKRLINAYFTPDVVGRYEEQTRALVTRLIDGFIEIGTCDFMSAFARPLPGLAFFELVLNAPSEEVEQLNEWATGASNPHNPDLKACWAGLTGWIEKFVELRRSGPRHEDVVDAILHAEIEGRPITFEEIGALILLLILGGLETTAGALGQTMIRFCQEPAIPALLRERTDLVPNGVEELLRLEAPFIFVGRTARHDAQIAGHTVRQGEKVLISWAAANRDETEFPNPDTFDPNRAKNRHVSFGAGPHRCAGSNLARMNLRIAVEELVRRLHDVEALLPAEDVPFHSAYNRAPLSLPIRFTPAHHTVHADG